MLKVWNRAIESLAGAVLARCAAACTFGGCDLLESDCSATIEPACSVSDYRGQRREASSASSAASCSSPFPLAASLGSPVPSSDCPLSSSAVSSST